MGAADVQLEHVLVPELEIAYKLLVGIACVARHAGTVLRDEEVLTPAFCVAEVTVEVEVAELLAGCHVRGPGGIGSSLSGDVYPACLRALLGNNADHGDKRIGAVERGAGTADDLNAFHVYQADRPHCLARATVIETAEPHAIDHDEQALVEIAGDTADGYELELLTGTTHVKAGHQLKNVIERPQTEGGDFVRCDDSDR